ncbi:uncharacterized protein BO96DRAFT_422401 [Aspergillus niger CBS 101883]|uniref:uncharacterized protein n=1 Tax=Aspergillus lacticoffeatus (strain CBS 101883) TaxID=1450533 RepID=UPI000D7FE0C0|nr:uncharacterized protein BO96DRAFT_422401 [Aspergillus niger CBS 101883]PYH57380.1 hypothetical protein BO96DRAFT_422401 [Aspergillus niger CBS 101883]
MRKRAFVVVDDDVFHSVCDRWSKSGCVVFLKKRLYDAFEVDDEESLEDNDDEVDDEGEEGVDDALEDADEEGEEEGKITAMREPELGREGPHIFNGCSFYVLLKRRDQRKKDKCYRLLKAVGATADYYVYIAQPPSMISACSPKVPLKAKMLKCAHLRVWGATELFCMGVGRWTAYHLLRID